MKRYIIIMLCAIAGMVSMAAQTPIRWRMTVKMTDATEGVVTLRALVEPGWHLYSTKLPANGPKPTVIDLSASTGVKFSGTPVPSHKALSVDDPMFGMRLDWWDANVEFTQKFKVTDADKARIEAKVTYMGCNNENCLPPKTNTFSYDIKK